MYASLQECTTCHRITTNAIYVYGLVRLGRLAPFVYELPYCISLPCQKLKMLSDLAPILALQYVANLIACGSWRSGILTGPFHKLQLRILEISLVVNPSLLVVHNFMEPIMTALEQSTLGFAVLSLSTLLLQAITLSTSPGIGEHFKNPDHVTLILDRIQALSDVVEKLYKEINPEPQDVNNPIPPSQRTYTFMPPPLLPRGAFWPADP